MNDILGRVKFTTISAWIIGPLNHTLKGQQRIEEVASIIKW